MGHLSSIGFGLEADAFRDLVAKVANEGESLPSSRGHYVRWSPEEGIELWIQADLDKLIVGCNPHFSGTGRMQFGLTRLLRNAEQPLDGGLYGWAAPDEKDPFGGLFEFAVDLPDFDLVRDRVRSSMVIELQIAAFAADLHCFLNDLYYMEAQEGRSNVPPEAFIPTGIADVGTDISETQPNRKHARAVLSGHVLRSERRTNPATGQEFRWLSVQTHGGTVDVVADPEIVTGYPRVGGVVSGDFWLSARILSALPPPKKQSIFRRNR